MYMNVRRYIPIANRLSTFCRGKRNNVFKETKFKLKNTIPKISQSINKISSKSLIFKSKKEFP